MTIGIRLLWFKYRPSLLQMFDIQQFPNRFIDMKHPQTLIKWRLSITIMQEKGKFLHMEIFWQIGFQISGQRCCTHGNGLIDKYKTRGIIRRPCEGSAVQWKLSSSTWWRHQMETFSALLAICAGNSPVTGEFPAQRPVPRSFDVFFNLRLYRRLSKQS